MLTCHFYNHLKNFGGHASDFLFNRKTCFLSWCQINVVNFSNKKAYFSVCHIHYFYNTFFKTMKFKYGYWYNYQYFPFLKLISISNLHFLSRNFRKILGTYNFNYASNIKSSKKLWNLRLFRHDSGIVYLLLFTYKCF